MTVSHNISCDARISQQYIVCKCHFPAASFDLKGFELADKQKEGKWPDAENEKTARQRDNALSGT